MEKHEYLKIKDEIEKGEIVPFYILKKYLNYKMENNIDIEKLIKFYRINDSISYNYLINIDIKNNYDDFLEMYNMLKFSLSETHLKEVSKNLAPNDFEQQKEFIYNKPLTSIYLFFVYTKYRNKRLQKNEVKHIKFYINLK